MNPDSVLNDVPFLGESAGRTYAPVKQFRRVMTPTSPHGFSYSPTIRGNSLMGRPRNIDAIRARRARLEALTTKVKLPPIVTNGGDVDLPPRDAPKSAVSKTPGSGGSQGRWMSASMRPPSTKGHPTVPLVYAETYNLPTLSLSSMKPYHNPLPDISKEKVVEEEEEDPGLATGLDSPPPPSKEDTFKVSKWVEELPDQTEAANDDEDVVEDIVQEKEEEDLGSQTPVFGESSTDVFGLKDSTSKSIEFGESRMSRDKIEVTKLPLGSPFGNKDEMPNKDTDRDSLFTVVRDKDSLDEGRNSRENELPVQDIEAGVDPKEGPKRTDTPYHSTYTFLNAFSSEGNNSNNVQQNASVEGRENGVGTENNVYMETAVTDLTPITEHKQDSSEDDVVDLFKNTDTISQENSNEISAITEVHSVNLGGVNFDTKHQEGNDNSNENIPSDKTNNFSSDEVFDLGDTNSESKDQEGDGSNEATHSDKVDNFLEDQELKSGNSNLGKHDQENEDQFRDISHGASKPSLQSPELLNSTRDENQNTSMQIPFSLPGGIPFEPEASAEKEANISDFKPHETILEDSAEKEADIPDVTTTSERIVDNFTEKEADISDAFKTPEKIQDNSAEKEANIPDVFNSSERILGNSAEKEANILENAAEKENDIPKEFKSPERILEDPSEKETNMLDNSKPPGKNLEDLAEGETNIQEEFKSPQKIIEDSAKQETNVPENFKLSEENLDDSGEKDIDFPEGINSLEKTLENSAEAEADNQDGINSSEKNLENSMGAEANNPEDFKPPETIQDDSAEKDADVPEDSKPSEGNQENPEEKEDNIPEDLRFLEKNLSDTESLNGDDADFVMPAITPGSSLSEAGWSKIAANKEQEFGSSDNKNLTPVQEADPITEVKPFNIMSETNETGNVNETKVTDLNTKEKNTIGDADAIWDL